MITDKLKKITLPRRTELDDWMSLYLSSRNLIQLISILLFYLTLCQNLDPIKTEFCKCHNSIIGLISGNDDVFG